VIYSLAEFDFYLFFPEISRYFHGVLCTFITCIMFKQLSQVKMIEDDYQVSS